MRSSDLCFDLAKLGLATSRILAIVLNKHFDISSLAVMLLNVFCFVTKSTVLPFFSFSLLVEKLLKSAERSQYMVTGLYPLFFGWDDEVLDFKFKAQKVVQYRVHQVHFDKLSSIETVCLKNHVIVEF